MPLLVRLPGGELGGTRVEAPVSLVDLMPTILSLAGAPLPEHLPGRSLLEERGGEAQLLAQQKNWFVARTDGWKYVSTKEADGRDERAFDLAADTARARPPARRPTTPRSSSSCGASSGSRSTRRARSTPPTAVSLEAERASEKDIQHLKDLGYLGS